MIKLKKTVSPFKKRNGLLIIITAALLLELLSAAQYSYTHNMVEATLEKRAESELALKAILIKGTLNQSENVLNNHLWNVQDYLSDPDSIQFPLMRIVDQGNYIRGCFMAFKPYYYPTKGELFEPYVTKFDTDSISFRQIGGSNHNYTNSIFYQSALAAGSAMWTDPYYDDVGSKAYVTSYVMPLKDLNDSTAGVVGIDMTLEWLRDTIDRRHLYPSSFVLVLTEDGKPIVRPNENRISKKITDGIIKLINDSTTYRYHSNNQRITVIPFTEDGRDGIVFYANMKGNPHWQIATVCYDDEVFAPLKQLRIRMLFLMLLAFGILLYVIFHYARNEKKLLQNTLEQERLNNELQIAADIQNHLLPKENSITRNDIEIVGALTPARLVGGDLYDFFLSDEKLYFCIGDVSGKGIPSAMVMSVTLALFRSISAHEKNPAHIMQAINQATCHGNESCMFVTFFIGVLDLPTGRLRYCNAGHDKPILIENGEQRMEDSKPNLPIGVFDDVKYDLHEFMLPAGSTLFLYTDGLTEARNSQNKLFGLDRLKEVLRHSEAKPGLLLQTVTDAINHYVEDAEQSDDLTMLAIGYTPTAENDILNETLTLKNDPHEVDQLSAFIKTITDNLQLEAALAKEIRLAVEEAVVNVMEYAYPAGTEGDVTIQAKSDGQQVTFVVSDRGVAFDPTGAAKADTTLSAEDRPIGGLGIFLVRKLMDSINYERVDGRNILTMRKKIN